MESEDYPFFQGLVYLLENDVSTLGYELTFSTEVGVLSNIYEFISSAKLSSLSFRFLIVDIAIEPLHFVQKCFYIF